MKAIFDCVVTKKGCPELRSRISLPVKQEVTTDKDLLLGKYFAMRRFKRIHELHPCTKVQCDFIGHDNA